MKQSWSTLALVAFACLGLLPGGLHGQEARMTLDRLYRAAWEESPRLIAARELVRASAAREPSAGLPPDPTVELGAMNLSLPDFSADMPASMVPSVEVMQMLPIGKLDASRTIAREATAIAEAEALAAWWAVRTDVAMAYHGLHESEAHVAIMRETLGFLDEMREVAQSMYATGTGRQSDVLRAAVERARMEADIRRTEAMGVAARARLNALLGRPADSPLSAAAPPAYAIQLPSLDTLRAWAESSQPMLERARAAVRQADAATDLARRELWPDISVGLGYGQRPSDMGTEHMGSLMIGFSVPVFARSRQLRMRDEMVAMRRMAEADLTMERAETDARLVELTAELRRAAELIALYENEILPQADANVASAFSSYRTGAVDFMTLIDARMSANQFEQELHVLLAEYGIATAEMEMIVGRELFPADRMDREDP